MLRSLLFSFIIFFGVNDIFARVSTCAQSLNLGEISELWVGDKIILYRRKQISSISFRPSTLFEDYDPTDFFIGFDGEHAYLLTDDLIRDDGYLFLDFKYSRTRLDSNLLNQGLIVRIRGLSEQIRLDIRTFLVEAEPKWTLTCGQRICSVLERGQLQIGGTHNYLVSHMIKNLLQYGIRGMNPGAYIDFYLTQWNSFEDFLASQVASEANVKKDRTLRVIKRFGGNENSMTGVLVFYLTGFLPR